MGGDSRDIVECKIEVANATQLSTAKTDSSVSQTTSSLHPSAGIKTNHHNCSKSVCFQSGPFQIIDMDCRGSADAPISPPRRRYSCQHYDTCLDLAAALNWDNYTCRGCSGSIDQKLLWRARQEIRKDKFVRAICSDMPDIGVHSTEQEELDETAEAVG